IRVSIFQLDHDGGTFGGRKLAKGRISRAYPGHSELVLELPSGRTPGLQRVSEAFAEKLVKKLGVDRGFLLLRQGAGGLEVGQMQRNGICIVPRCSIEALIGSGLLDVAWNEQGPLAANTSLKRLFVLFEEAWTLLGIHSSFGHAEFAESLPCKPP